MATAPITTGLPNVRYKRPELREAMKQYDIVRDCVEGEMTVKRRKTKYLPMPNEADETAQTARYDAYITRAVFYNVTRRTLDGLCGQVFSRDPVIEVPDSLDVVVKNVDGSGIDITQMAKKAARYGIAYGRAGLLTDYPVLDAPVTQAQLTAGDIRPTMTLFAPDKIINWRIMERGSRIMLSMVVLEEPFLEADDGFEQKTRTRHRVLKMVGNVYTVELWEGATGQSTSPSLKHTFVPKNSKGESFTEIPFTFIGAENNDSFIDQPPMYDIAALNIAHYRNSADYEESSFMAGQPTPVFAGLSEDWVKNVLKGKVQLGSRAAVSLPANGTAMLLQAQANSMPIEAMNHKEKQMVALGARIVEQKQIERTATEVSVDQTTENSVLASIARNVSAAFTFALGIAAQFIGETDTKIKFELNTDFDIASMTAEERRQMIEEWQTGGISWEELRMNLRKAGIAHLDDKIAREQIDKELAAMPVVTAPGSVAKPKAKANVAA